ncbi:alpha-galactosidase [Lactobacillus colini]|uniref:Alpha-galactosidase n=1 Tax=Lactobacillus colini TaxID=1819254 RepID=A0ABS4MFT6_9LACO|nr:alpha-galactosidase [Lactobacillus colini]MBP2058232.1 alpha-galactosidase [Lactobacillus colini]
MIEYLFNKYFHLHNDKTSYLFYIMENGELGHLYYGRELGELTREDLEYLKCDKSKSAGTVKYSPDIPNFSLADHESEFPVNGTSDFREGAINLDNGNEYLYPSFEFEDYKINNIKKRTLDFPKSYAEVGESETLSIRLVDKEHQLELILNYTIFKNSSAIVRSAQIKNLGENIVYLTNMQSSLFTLDNNNWDFLQLSGAWLKERHIKKRPLIQGITKVESLRGASSHHQNPFIALTEKKVGLNQGKIYASNLIYSGNFISQAEVNEWGVTRVMTGINPSGFRWLLKPGQSFKTPEGVMFFTENGYNGLMNETHYFTQKYVIDRKWQYEKRPIVINSWEAYVFNFNEEKLLQLAKEGKALGMECFVLDDGWFGHRDTDNTSLGDWTVNRKKFPRGLNHFSQKLHQMGMQFGLWFEPEMISPDTSLYKSHPDWIVRHPYSRAAIGRGQYVLDFSNPQVVDNIYQQMAKIIEDCKVDYIKWDMNRYITEAYSPYLKKQNLPQGEFFHRYIKGVYELYSKLLTNFPNLLIEGCASGGGRYDLGIMYYSPQIWPSDDSDAVERLDIMQGTLLAYPLSTFSNHVSDIPNGQVGRNTNLKFSQDFASFGPLGYELDLNKLSPSDKQKIRNQINWYKQKRDLLVNGKFSNLLPIEDKNTYAFEVSNEENMIIGFYRKLARANDALNRYFSILNVNQDREYQVNKVKLSGSILKRRGLREPYQFNGANKNTAELIGDFQSYIYQIKMEK